MNEGHVAILVILATIGALITMVHYRDLIVGSPQENKPVRKNRAVQVQRSRRSEASNALNGVQRHSIAETAQLERSNVQPERSSTAIAESPALASDVLTLTNHELARLAIAIKLRTEGNSKQASLEQAYGISKGASPAWQRASQLFDIAYGKLKPDQN
jgi:hypothetical protein